MKRRSTLSVASLAQEFSSQAGGALYAYLLLALVFLTGGASRADVQSLLILRPAAAAVLFYLIFTRWGRLNEVKRFLVVLAAIALLILIELIPLPRSVWTALPGREIIAQIDAVAGFHNSWRPIAINPHFAWNSLFSLVVPAAAFVVAAIASTDSDDKRIAKLVLGFIVTGALLGIFQLVSGGDPRLYLYRISNFDSTVGFFANRNHHALALAAALPLIAYVASELKGAREKATPKQVALLLLAILLAPLIVLTGSRAGLAYAVIGIGFALLAYRPPALTERRTVSRWASLNIRRLSLLLSPIPILATVFAGRMTAFDRIGLGGEIDRLTILPALWATMVEFFPVGAGAGSFVTVFRMLEPEVLLQPAYYNHAHNDILEIMIEHGALGAIFVILAFILFGVTGSRVLIERMKGQRSSRNSLAICGVAILTMSALGSLVDYPLRVPIIQLLACFSIVWISRSLSIQQRK